MVVRLRAVAVAMLRKTAAAHAGNPSENPANLV
jgi:hypothetical protein